MFPLRLAKGWEIAIPDLASWNGLYVKSRSEPAEAPGLAVVMLLGNAGFGERRVKFCNLVSEYS